MKSSVLFKINLINGVSTHRTRSWVGQPPINLIHVKEMKARQCFDLISDLKLFLANAAIIGRTLPFGEVDGYYYSFADSWKCCNKESLCVISAHSHSLLSLCSVNALEIELWLLFNKIFLLRRDSSSVDKRGKVCLNRGLSLPLLPLLLAFITILLRYVKLWFGFVRILLGLVLWGKCECECLLRWCVCECECDLWLWVLFAFVLVRNERWCLKGLPFAFVSLSLSRRCCCL